MDGKYLKFKTDLQEARTKSSRDYFDEVLHDGQVTKIAVSLDGDTIGFVANSQVRVVDALTGVLKGIFKGSSVALNSDGSRIVTSERGVVRLWNEEGKRLFKVGDHSSSAREKGPDQVVGCTVAFSPNGSLIAAPYQGKSIRLLLLSSGQCVATLNGHSRSISALAFCPTGTALASGSKDANIRLWSPASGSCTACMRGHGGTVTCIAYSLSGLNIVSADEQGLVRLWDVEDTTCIHILNHRACVINVSFSPDSLTVLSASSSHVRLWCSSTGECFARLGDSFGMKEWDEGSAEKDFKDERGARIRLRDWQRHSRTITCALFSPDGCTIVVGAYHLKELQGQLISKNGKVPKSASQSFGGQQKQENYYHSKRKTLQSGVGEIWFWHC